MSHALLIAVSVFSAIMAMRSKKLILSAIWLACTSALLSIFFYQLNARQVAVIELSVGAGLVTVLLIFAISVAGDEGIEARSLIPKSLMVGLTLIMVALLLWFTVPQISSQSNPAEPALATVLWDQRGLDVLVQVVLIFAGVLGLLGLLAEVKPPLEKPMADEFAAIRERELKAIERGTEDSLTKTPLPVGIGEEESG